MPELQFNKLGDPRGKRSEKNDLKVFKFGDEKRGMMPEKHVLGIKSA